MPKLSPASSCPVCGKAGVSRIEPVKISWSAPTHKCNVCGAALVTLLGKAAWVHMAVGVLLMFGVFFLYQAFASVFPVSPMVRIVALLALLGATYGFSASRILRSLTYRPWSANHEQPPEV